MNVFIGLKGTHFLFYFETDSVLNFEMNDKVQIDANGKS